MPDPMATPPFGNTHRPDETRPCNGGIQHRFRFANGYGASVIRHEYSYGSEAGRWELAVLADGHLTYITPITDDVLGWLTEDEVAGLLDDIAALPARAQVAGGAS